MKTKSIFFTLIVLCLFLTACAWDGTAPVDESNDGMDFTEEEAIEVISEEGFDFSDDEGLAVENNDVPNPSVEENDAPDGMDFDENEAVAPIQEPGELYPPEGTSSWMFDHDAAISICEPYGEYPVSEPESETLTITLGAEGASLVIAELYAGIDVSYVLEVAGADGSTYYGYVKNPVAGNEIHYEIVFFSINDREAADRLSGTLRSELEGCVITRSFVGNRLD